MSLVSRGTLPTQLSAVNNNVVMMLFWSQQCCTLHAHTEVVKSTQTKYTPAPSDHTPRHFGWRMGGLIKCLMQQQGYALARMCLNNSLPNTHTHFLTNWLCIALSQSTPSLSFILSRLILSIVSPPLLHSCLHFFYIPVVGPSIACSFSTPKCSNESWCASLSVRKLNRVVVGVKLSRHPVGVGWGWGGILHCVSPFQTG